MNPFVADPQWGWWIILYFYLGGLAAGAYFLATLVALFGHEEDAAVSRIGYRIALPLVMVCGVLLIVDLQRPERFWHMLLQSQVVHWALEEGWPAGGWETMVYALNFKRWSPMSIGAWCLMVFGLCSALSFLGTLWPGGTLERLLSRGILGRTLQVVGSLVGFFLGAYTGVLLTASNQPLWSLSDWIGPLFLTSSASTGVAAVVLVVLVGHGTSHATFERLEKADLWATALELLVFLIFLASLRGVLPLALHTWPGWVMVAGTLVLALLIPFALHLRAGAHEPGRMAVAAICALVGGFAVRYGVLGTAPVLLDRWPELTGGEPPGPLWQTAGGLVLLLVTGVVAVLIPWLLKRHWRLTSGQTVFAGLASLVVCGCVTAYAVMPASATPYLEQWRAPWLSPEDGREVGGGVGASLLNQPGDDVDLRSKITGTLPQ